MTCPDCKNEMALVHFSLTDPAEDRYKCQWCGKISTREEVEE